MGHSERVFLHNPWSGGASGLGSVWYKEWSTLREAVGCEMGKFEEEGRDRKEEVDVKEMIDETIESGFSVRLARTSCVMLLHRTLKMWEERLEEWAVEGETYGGREQSPRRSLWSSTTDAKKNLMHTDKEIS